MSLVVHDCKMRLEHRNRRGVKGFQFTIDRSMYIVYWRDRLYFEI